MKVFIAMIFAIILAAALADPYTTLEYLYSPRYISHPVVRGLGYPLIPSYNTYYPYWFDGKK